MNLTALCARYNSGIFTTSHTTAVHICTGPLQWGSAQTTLDLKNLIIKLTSIPADPQNLDKFPLVKSHQVRYYSDSSGLPEVAERVNPGLQMGRGVLVSKAETQRGQAQ